MKKFNGTSWELVGTPNFSSTNARGSHLDFWENNTPLVTYSQHNGIFAKFFGEENALSISDTVILSQQITIAPNPVTGTFTVSANVDVDAVCVFDLLGKEIIRTSETTVDLSAIQPGLYIVKVKTGSGIYTHKIFKK